MKLLFKNISINKQVIRQYKFSWRLPINISHAARRAGTSQFQNHGHKSWKTLEL
jgi:hypothetical protein